MSEDKGKNVNPKRCIHCHKCRENCTFLTKYRLDIGDIGQWKKLLYHCFLCGKCTGVCPQGIDGRQVVLNMRCEQVEENGGCLREEGYTGLLREKVDYLYRNYDNGTRGSVLFAGCSFPSYFPETTKRLAALLKEKAGIGIVFDCCGKPVAELGLREDAGRIIERIDRKLTELHIDEVIMVCPNCYAYLKDRLTARVVTIYEKLAELGIGRKISGKTEIFPPCPDREKWEILSHIRPFLEEEPELITKIQCCGLGGCAGQKEPDLAGQMLEDISERKGIYTYCASCSGNIARKGYGEVGYLLLEILGSREKPDVFHAIDNRRKAKDWQGPGK